MHELEAQLLKTFEDQDYCVESIHTVQRIPLMGYHPNGAVPMQKITLKAPRFVSVCRDILENRGLTTYEGNVQYVLRYLVDHGIGGNDWVVIDDYFPTALPETRCDIEIDFKHLEKLADESQVGLQRWLAFDIEACKGGSGHGFVNPANDIVSQIGNTLFDSSYNVLDRRVFSMGGSVAKLKDDIQVQVFTDEAQMLLAWRDYILERDPDAFTGYNIDGFDWWYLFERAKALGIYDEFRKLGKDLDRLATIKKASFASAAKGARLDYEVNIEGRFNFDMLKFIKDTMKLRSYTLGNVSKHVLDDSKVEMDYKLIPVYQAGTDEQRAHLCYYCWYDADLCMRLMRKRMAIVNYVETSRVCGVPMKFLITRGQQVLTLSLLLRYGQKRGYVVPSSTESQNDEDTKGATVLEPLKGFYKCWIMVLDFQSLYPSIIRDKNICYSTKTPLKWAKDNLKPTDYFVPPISGCSYCYVKDHISVGLLAEIEETLFNKRLAAKADLKRETDPNKRDVLDGRQLAIKVRMNSIYGFLKANMVCDKDLMETVTSVGRNMIDQSKTLVESTFPGSQVVYGDSVTGDTPCLVKHVETGRLSVQTISELGHTWEVGLDGKEYLADRIHYRVWTEEGWTGIRRVIRHKAKKPIFRVLTHTGVVDCTSDHGLITADGIRVSSNDVKIGDSLLHSFNDNWTENYSLDEIRPKDAKEANAWGLFMADGSCGDYGEGQKRKRTWAINKADKVLLEETLKNLENTHDGVTFKILDTLESSKVYKLVACGDVKSIVERYRKVFYDNHKYKIVPEVILNSPIEIRQAFWDGYYRGDGDKAFLRSDIKGKIGAAGLYTLLRSLGYNVSINTRSDKLDIYRLTATKSKQRKDSITIKKIDPLPPTDEYVYDLETENHHFHAGVGQLIVHNTDSIFVKFGEHNTIEEVFKLGEKAAALCTQLFTREKNVHLLQMEKGFYPLLLCGKKRYAGYKYMSVDAKPFVDSSGMETVRRDNAKIASETQQRCLDLMLKEGDYDGSRSIAHVRQVLRDLLMGRIEMSKLIISKSLSKTFKQYAESGAMLPHVELAKKIKARGDEEYHTGDRVKYVVISGLKGAKSSECAEDPAYVLRNRLNIDYDYYVYNQMMKPLLRIFTPILAPNEQMVKTNKSGQTVYINDEEIKKLTAYKALFTGDHMMHRVQRVKENASTGIMQFAKKLPTCVGCGCRSEQGVCPSCQPRAASLYIAIQQEHKETQLKAWQAWTRCQVCVGDKHVHRIDCSNKDCDNFYHREKVIYDIEDLAEKLSKF